MSNGSDTSDRAARWIVLRRRVIIVGLLLATLNVAFTYLSTLSARSRAALTMMSDLNLAFSSPGLTYARPCMHYLTTSSTPDFLRDLASQKEGISLPITADIGLDILKVCLAGMLDDERLSKFENLDDITKKRATHYIRRQVFSYFNAFEIIFRAWKDNTVDYSTFCKELTDLGENPMTPLFAKFREATPKLDSALPALVAYYKGELRCDQNWLVRFFERYISFAVPFI